MDLRHTYIKYKILVSVKVSRGSEPWEFRTEKIHCSVRARSGRGEVVALEKAWNDKLEVGRCQEKRMYMVWRSEVHWGDCCVWEEASR